MCEWLNILSLLSLEISLNISFPSLRPQRTMTSYELNTIVSSPVTHSTFIEFSPDGRFLAVGDRGRYSLHILDRSAGFHPTLYASTFEEPTALVWETSTAFYVGMADGRFTHYWIDLKDKELVQGKTNHTFRGVFPVTAMALDMESRTLVFSVGPEVFAFRRIRATSTFQFSMNQNTKVMSFKVNLISPATYPTDLISRTILGGRFLRSRELFALPPTIPSL